MTRPATLAYLRGALYGLAAASIWSGWVVASRFGVRTSLTPWDITAIRFAVAGLILLPYLLKKSMIGATARRAMDPSWVAVS